MCYLKNISKTVDNLWVCAIKEDTIKVLFYDTFFKFEYPSLLFSKESHINSFKSRSSLSNISYQNRIESLFNRSKYYRKLQNMSYIHRITLKDIIEA